MKICYLIAAHNTPNHLKRLIDALWAPEDAIYVHIDAKCRLTDFLHRQDDGVVYLADRVAVSWAGFTQVEATLDLLSRALAAEGDSDYFCFISGSDYPVRSQEDIHRFFAENSGRQFMNLVAMPSEAVNKPISRLTTYHVDDESVRRYLRSQCLAHGCARAINRLGLKREYETRFGEIRPYAGSSWWVLSRPAARYVVDFVSAHEEIMRFFKNTRMPDESVFQTIIGNSPYRESVTRNVTFADWNRPQGPYPATIDEAHIAAFASGDFSIDDGYGSGQALFARKFPDQSETLVRAVQAQVW